MRNGDTRHFAERGGSRVDEPLLAKWRVSPFLLLVLAMVAGAGPGSASRMRSTPEGPPPDCAIQLEFRMRHGGFDGQTFDRVLRFLDTEPDIEHIYDERDRYEDPPSLCLVIDNADRALKIFEDLTRLVPPQRAKLPRLKPPPGVVLRYKGS